MPAGLVEGNHIFEGESVVTERWGTPVASSPTIASRIVLRVIDSVGLSLSMTQDQDNDGVSDLIEGIGDSDGDLIPDYLDRESACELQVIDNSRAVNGGFVLQSSPGTCLNLGHVSSSIDEYSPVLHVTDKSVTSGVLTPDNAHLSEYLESDVVNFNASGLTSSSLVVVVPMLEPYRAGGVYRKYTEATGWMDFDTSEVGSGLRYTKASLASVRDRAPRCTAMSHKPGITVWS
ncbi:fibronectin type III domain protein [Vibrio ponticus]|nr:fibronectin type III domain protein [Vibrio ponticus]